MEVVERGLCDGGGRARCFVFPYCEDEGGSGAVGKCAERGFRKCPVMGRNEGEGVGWESAEDPAFGFSDSVMETESRNIREESDIARWSGGGVGGFGGPQDGGVDCRARGRREGVAIGGVPGGGEGVVLEAPRVVGVVSGDVGAEAGVAVDGIRESFDREGEGFYDALHYKRVSGPVVVSSVGETGVMKAGGGLGRDAVGGFGAEGLGTEGGGGGRRGEPVAMEKRSQGLGE